MEFNPRTATGIPTEPVGSVPRPLKLQQAYAAYDAKKITKAQLEEEQRSPTPSDASKRPDHRLSRTVSSASRALLHIRSPIRLRELDWRPT